MEGRECYRLFAEFALIIIITYIYIAQTSIWIYSVALMDWTGSNAINSSCP